MENGDTRCPKAPRVGDGQQRRNLQLLPPSSIPKGDLMGSDGTDEREREEEGGNGCCSLLLHLCWSSFLLSLQDFNVAAAAAAAGPR